MTGHGDAGNYVCSCCGEDWSLTELVDHLDVVSMVPESDEPLRKGMNP